MKGNEGGLTLRCGSGASATAAKAVGRRSRKRKLVEKPKVIFMVGLFVSRVSVGLAGDEKGGSSQETSPIYVIIKRRKQAAWIIYWYGPFTIENTGKLRSRQTT